MGQVCSMLSLASLQPPCGQNQQLVPRPRQAADRVAAVPLPKRPLSWVVAVAIAGNCHGNQLTCSELIGTPICFRAKSPIAACHTFTPGNAQHRDKARQRSELISPQQCRVTGWIWPFASFVLRASPSTCNFFSSTPSPLFMNHYLTPPQWRISRLAREPGGRLFRSGLRGLTPSPRAAVSRPITAYLITACLTFAWIRSCC